MRISYPPNSNRASNVPVRIEHAAGDSRLTVNQRLTPPIEGVFQSLGRFEFAEVGSVTIGTENTDGYVVIDAVQFLPVGK